jgi:hypothetical protein
MSESRLVYPLRRTAVVGLLIAALTLIVLAGFQPAAAQSDPSVTVYAVTGDGRLISFNASSPGSTLTDVAISGLGEGENIVGIDIRPATGQLFALSSASRLYVLDVSSGAASGVGGVFSTALNGANFGFDFNPTVDRIRLVSDARQNLRLNPNNGAVAAVDGTLSYGASDPNAGATPNIVASAYTNNFGGSGSTTLYNIDAGLDVLVIQNPPNAGGLVTVGPLGVDAGSQTSFDIMSDRNGSDNAFAAIGSSLYQINLATGEASLIGGIGTSVRGIAVTGSVRQAAPVPSCADLTGSTSPVVSAGIPDSMTGSVFCRVLIENRQTLVSNAGAQIGVQAVLDQGIIQAVDIFVADGSTAAFAAPVTVCLLGEGRLIYLDASQSPRTPQLLSSSVNNGYTCGTVVSTGTAVLVNP